MLGVKTCETHYSPIYTKDAPQVGPGKQKDRLFREVGCYKIIKYTVSHRWRFGEQI